MNVHQSPLSGGATFPLQHRLFRLVWSVAWVLLARWTPPPLFFWRRSLACWFGAQLDPTAKIYSTVEIWDPRNLKMAKHSALGPGVLCYSMAEVTLKEFAIVSQRAFLCGGSHDADDPAFPLVTRPIVLGAYSWIGAEAFVGPGVHVGEGAVLGARAVAARDLDEWTIYVGNPAKAVRSRVRPI